MNTDTIQVRLSAKFVENSEEILRKKIASYNLGDEFKYAVAVLKLSINNGEKSTGANIGLVITPVVHYIVPFITEDLAKQYCEEISSTSRQFMMFLRVENGRAVYENGDINVIKLPDENKIVQEITVNLVD